MRKTLVAGIALVLALILTAVGIAIWSTSQTGGASTRVGQAGQFSFGAGPAPGAPGGPPPASMIAGPGASGSGSIAVTTTSGVPLKLTTFAATSAPVTVSNAPGCDPTNFIPNTSPQTLPTPVTLAPNATTDVELPNAISLASTAPISCAGANVNFTVTATVTQGS